MDSLDTFDHFLLVMRDVCGNRTESFELQTDQRRSTHTRPWLSETAFQIWAVSKGQQSPAIPPLTVAIGGESASFKSLWSVCAMVDTKILE